MSLSKHRRDLATDSEFSIVGLPEKRPRTSVLALMPPPSDPHPSETSLDDQEDPEEIINNLSYGGLQPELRDLVTT